jgi:uncharacterized protein (TIGR02996 family)
MNYWNWINKIKQKPYCTTTRLVFADWLDEQGCTVAAKKQRATVKLIERCYVIYSVVTPQYSGKNGRLKPKKVYGLISTKNQDMIVEFKNDGRLIVGRYKSYSSQKHVLFGSFKINNYEIRIQYRKKLRKAFFSHLQKKKERQQGHVLDRWSVAPGIHPIYRVPKRQVKLENNISSQFTTFGEPELMTGNPCSEVHIVNIENLTDEQIVENLRNKQETLNGNQEAMRELIKQN